MGEYDLILMDLQMPILDGFKASKIINSFSRNIPIVALSAAVMQEDKARTKEAGMVAHLAKPIDQNELIKTLISFIKPKVDIHKPKKVVETNKKNESELNELYGVDLEELKSRVVDNPDVIKKIILSFCDNYKDVDKMLDIEDVDSDEFKRVIHSLKGVSGNVSLKDIYHLSKEIHDCNDLDKKRELSPKLVEMVKETVYHLREQLNDLSKTKVVNSYDPKEVTII